MSETDDTIFFVAVAKIGDVPEDCGIKVEVAGLEIAIFKFDGEFYATDDSCSHANASLAEGYVADGTVECPLHGACFSLRTGEALSEPATEPVKTYPVRVDGDEILVGLSQQGRVP